jgi:hypothetical protein
MKVKTYVEGSLLIFFILSFIISLKLEKNARNEFFTSYVDKYSFTVNFCPNASVSFTDRELIEKLEKVKKDDTEKVFMMTKDKQCSALEVSQNLEENKYSFSDVS